MVRGPVGLEEVLDAAAHFRDVCNRLDPDEVPLDEVESVVDELAVVQKAAGGGLVRLAARYEEAGAWRRSGCKSPEDGLSRKTGTSTKQARRNLRTSKRLKQQPKTDQALKQGQLSPDQANEVSDAADA